MSARRRGAVVVAVAAIAFGAVGVACGVPLEDETKVIPSDDVPFELLDAAPTTTTTTTVVDAGTTTTEAVDLVLLYFVSMDRIVRVEREVPDSFGVEERLKLLTQPLTADEAEQGLRSAVPPSSINDWTLERGVATVDLLPTFTEIQGNEQTLAFAQITFTLSQVPGIGQVAFTLNGAAIQPLDVNGTVIPGPVTFETYQDLLA